MINKYLFYRNLFIGLLFVVSYISSSSGSVAQSYKFNPSLVTTSDKPSIDGAASGGTPGDVIFIPGRHLQSVTSVYFNGVKAKAIKTDPKGFFVEATVPAQATTGPITIQTMTGSVTTKDPFHILDKPVMDANRRKQLASDPKVSIEDMVEQVMATMSVKQQTNAEQANVVAAGATITGVKFEDVNKDGTRNSQVITNALQLIFTIDVSGSTVENFAGTSVGDLNSDGYSNTKLDAEIAVIQRVRTQLLSAGADSRTTISLIKFSSTSAVVAGSPFALTNSALSTSGFYHTNFAGVGGTNYQTALTATNNFRNTTFPFNESNPTRYNIKVLFLSDGEPNEPNSLTATYSSQVTALKAKPDVSVSALGLGSTSSLPALQAIDPNARKVTDFDNLIDYAVKSVVPLESGLAGVTIYLDLNFNGQLDLGEPSQVTQSNDVNTTGDETGTYSFTGLAPRGYIVREQVPAGYIQTAPANKFYFVMVSGTQSYTDLNFGNVKDDVKPVISGVPASVTVNCSADVPSLASTVSATDNSNVTPELSFSSTQSDIICTNRFTLTRTWTATDQAGNSATATQTITVNDNIAPTLNGLPTQPVSVSLPAGSCKTSIQFPAITASDNCSGDITIRYTVNDNLISTDNQFAIGSTTVTVTATDVCGNQTVNSFVVTLKDITPPAPDLAQLPTLVQECSLQVSSRPTATDECSQQVTGTTADPLTYSVPGNYTITWTYTDQAGNKSQQTQQVQVNALKLTLSNDGPLTCNKASVTLSASGGSSYQFSAGAVPINDGSTATVTNEGVYSVTVTGAGGCTATVTTTVQSNTAAPQNVTLNNDGPLTCSKTSVSLSAGSSTQDVSYSFSGSGVTNSNGSTATANQSGSYTVKVTGTNGCTASQSTQVTSNAAAPTTTLTNNGPLSDSNPTVMLTAGGGGSYQFSQGATQQGSGNTATVTSPGTYLVTVTGTNGCTATASTTVTGGQNPTTICRNGTAVVNVVTSGNPVKYEWYRNSTATVRLMDIPNFQRGTSTASLTLINQQTTASYYVRVTDANGSSVVYGPLKVTVNTNCSANARLSAEEVSLQITVLGNPVNGEQLRAIIGGASGKALSVQLLDLSGKPIRSQQWQQAGSDQLVEWSMSGQASGVYLLQAVSSLDGSGTTQRQSVKVIKP